MPGIPRAKSGKVTAPVERRNDYLACQIICEGVKGRVVASTEGPVPIGGGREEGVSLGGIASYDSEVQDSACRLELLHL